MSRSEPLSELLDFAIELAWRMGRVTLAHYQTGVGVETKPDDSPVTVADREAERLARSLIRERFPDDDVLGEEFGVTRGGAAREDAATRCWVLDPIDGTKSFICGVPFYGVLVALEDVEAARAGVAGGPAADAQPRAEPPTRESLLGVLHFPALGETVYAARGLGCRWNGRRARVSDVDRVEDAVVVTTDLENIDEHDRRAGWDRLRSRVRFTRTWGDAYGYALVATGRAEAMLDPVVAHWDVAPLRPIMEEAGGVFTDWDGAIGPTVEHAVATNAALDGEIRGLLASDAGARGGAT